MEPILESLSPDIGSKVDEITSVIIVAEAGDKHIVLSLPGDKRQLLLGVVGA
jgi:hypothetical protein